MRVFFGLEAFRPGSGVPRGYGRPGDPLKGPRLLSKHWTWHWEVKLREERFEGAWVPEMYAAALIMPARTQHPSL